MAIDAATSRGTDVLSFLLQFSNTLYRMRHLVVERWASERASQRETAAKYSYIQNLACAFPLFLFCFGRGGFNKESLAEWVSCHMAGG